MQLSFEGKTMHTQYCIRNKSLDGYLPKYKVGKEKDEYDHVDRDPEYEKKAKIDKRSWN